MPYHTIVVDLRSASGAANLAPSAGAIANQQDSHPVDQLNEMVGDLLVMGEFGHSRFSEMVLGGATRRVLDNMKTPVLMSH